MAQLLQAPTEGYEDAIVIPEINANFKLKHGIDQSCSKQTAFRNDKEDPHAHIRYFNKITSTMRFPDIPSTSIKQTGSARIWLEKEPPRSILTWDDLVSKISFIYSFLPSTSDNLRKEITRFQQRFDESFYEAWDRFNDLLRACPHHGFSELHQLDVAALTTGVSELKNYDDDYVIEPSKSQAPASKYAKSRPSTLGNTVTNPKEDLKGITTRSGIAYKGPTIPTSYPKVAERKTEVTKDTIFPTNNGIIEDVQPPVFLVENQNPVSEPDVAPVSAPMTNPKPSIPYPSRRNDEKHRENGNEQKEKFYEIFEDMSFEISFMDALTIIQTGLLVVDFKPDPRVPLILEGCFLKTSRALIDVYEGSLGFFRPCSALWHPTPGYDPIVSNSSPTLTPFGDMIVSPIRNQGNYLPEIRKELKICEAKTAKSSIDEPPEVELKDLPPHLEYAFLEDNNKLRS
ncbi:reverse transcriptase domain-containing protein [Tanacetum coccineum]